MWLDGAGLVQKLFNIARADLVIWNCHIHKPFAVALVHFDNPVSNSKLDLLPLVEQTLRPSLLLLPPFKDDRLVPSICNDFRLCWGSLSNGRGCCMFGIACLMYLVSSKVVTWHSQLTEDDF